MHCDIDGFAMVDGSYTGVADVYLGDTSSQVIEFLMRPRPCVFLNAGGAAWEGDPNYAMWACGEVVDDVADVVAAVDRVGAGACGVCGGSGGVCRAVAGAVEGGAARAAGEIVRLLEPRPSDKSHHPGGGRGPVGTLPTRTARGYSGRSNWAPAFAGVVDLGSVLRRTL